jgi:hypothetical protein
MSGRGCHNVVFLRLGFSDSVINKIAFNNPYRFAAVIFPAC